MADAPLALSADPMAGIAQLFQLLSQGAPQADFSALDARRAGYDKQAQDAEAGIRQILGMPSPQVDPREQFIMRATAGAADALTGGNQTGQADEDIRTQNAQLRQNQIARFQRLEALYSENAKRAAEMGDHIAEAKALEKANSYFKQLDALRQVTDLAERAKTAREAHADRVQTNSLEALRIKQAERRLALDEANRNLPATVRWRVDYKSARVAALENEREALVRGKDEKGNPLFIKDDRKTRVKYDQLTKQIDTITSEIDTLIGKADGSKPGTQVPASAEPEDPIKAVADQAAAGTLPSSYEEFRTRVAAHPELGAKFKGGLPALLTAARKHYATTRPPYRDIPGFSDQVGPAVDVLRRFMLLDPSAADTLNVGGPNSGGFIIPRF